MRSFECLDFLKMDASDDDVSLVDIVKTAAKAHLFNDLGKLEGPKLFVWEEECMRRIDLVCLFRFFAQPNIYESV